VNLLIAGYDKSSEECKFYALDYLGSKVETKFSAHGYGGFFSMALMDRKYRDGEENLHDFFLNRDYSSSLFILIVCMC